MKRLVMIAAIIFLFYLIVSTPYAVRKLDDSLISDVQVTVLERDGEWTADLTVWGDVMDETDTYTHREVIYLNRKDLPANVRAMLDNFLTHLSKEFNKQTADEDSATLPPLN